MPGTVQSFFPSMGTVNSITVYDEKLRDTVDRAREFVLGLERSLSVFREDSELSRLNSLKSPEWMPVSSDTFSVIETGVHCGKMTGGAFDITAGPLSMLWKETIRTHRLPDRTEIENARNLVGYRRLLLDRARKRVRFRRSGQSVDPGGIAKGFAADRVSVMLADSGAEEFVLNFGGTVGAFGRERSIGIRDPFHTSGTLGTIKLRDSFAVTSGSYERSVTIEGTRRHHIIDPLTGYPSDSGLSSVTLVGKTAAELDALATAVFILGIERSVTILKENGTEAVFVTEEGEVLITPGLGNIFRFSGNSGGTI